MPGAPDPDLPGLTPVAQPQVKVTGLPAVRRTLRQLDLGTDDLKAANAAAASIVAAAAAARAPRRSGRLAASIRGNRAVGRATVKAGGAALPYAGPVHYGWPAHGIEPNPFVIDAAQATQPVWLAAYQADLDRLLDHLD